MLNLYRMYFTDYDNKIKSVTCRANSKQDAIEKWLDRFDEDENDLFSVELIIE